MLSGNQWDDRTKSTESWRELSQALRPNQEHLTFVIWFQNCHRPATLCLPFSPLLKRNVYSSYPSPVPLLYVRCTRQLGSWASQAKSKLNFRWWYSRFGTAADWYWMTLVGLSILHVGEHELLWTRRRTAVIGYQDGLQWFPPPYMVPIHTGSGLVCVTKWIWKGRVYHFHAITKNWGFCLSTLPFICSQTSLWGKQTNML